MVHVDILAKVGLDAGNAHFEQRFQELVLIPIDSLRVSEIDGAGIVEGREIGSAARRGVFCFRGLTDVTIGLGFFQLLSTLGHIRQLPQGHLETILLEMLDETLGVWKTLRIELPLAEPVGAEPTRIEVDDIAGIMLFAKTVAYLIDLVGREIGHATHPNAKRPKRRHLRETRQHAIAAQNLLRTLAADEENIEGGVVVEELHRTRAVVGQRELAIVGSMIETAVHPAAHKERNVLIATTVVDTLSVLVLQLESLSAEVHLAKAFTRAHEALVGSAFEGDGGALVVCRIAVDETEGECIVAGRREVVVAKRNALGLVAIRIEGDEGRRLRRRQEVAPRVELGGAEVDGGQLFAIGCDQVAAY